METGPIWSWSKKKYGIREFAELFYDQLPMIAKIDELKDEDEEEEEEERNPTGIANSVCCIHSIHLQPRVVTRTTTDDQYISIPKKYPFRFHSIGYDGSKSEPLTVVELLAKHSPDLKGMRIQMAQADQLTLSEKVECDIFGSLLVTGTYSEKYLLITRLDKKDGAVTSLATFLPLEISVLSASCGQKDFEEFKEKLISSISPPTYEDNSEELLIFSHPPNDDEYEFVFPSNFITVGDHEIDESRSNSNVPQSQPPILPHRSPPSEQSIDQNSRGKNHHELHDRLVGGATRNKKDEDIYEDFAPRSSRALTRDNPGVQQRCNSGERGGKKEVSWDLTHPTNTQYPHNTDQKDSTVATYPTEPFTPATPVQHPDPAIDQKVDFRPIGGHSPIRKSHSCGQLLSSHLVSSSDQSDEVIQKQAFRSPSIESKPDESGKKQTRHFIPARLGQSLSKFMNFDRLRPKPFKRRSASKNITQDPAENRATAPSGYSSWTGTESSDKTVDQGLKQQQHHHRSLAEDRSNLESNVVSSGKEESADPSTDWKGHALAKIENELSFPTHSANDQPISMQKKHPNLPELELQPQRNPSSQVRTTSDSVQYPGSDQTLCSTNLTVGSSSATAKVNQVSMTSLRDVPVDISQLSVNEVAKCLLLLNLDQYITLFQECQVDGELLSCLDEDILMQDFGLKRFDAIKLFKFSKCGWRPKVE